ncbi:MAG: tetratricopeptide repeat protein [Myxococcales bacterium]|nr:tetratricopeptide repeat protein [Myxococcales bacterium]
MIHSLRAKTSVLLVALSLVVTGGCGGAKPASSPAPEPEAPPQVDLTDEVLRAESLIGNGELGEAFALLEDILGKDPKNKRAWLDMGLVHEMMGHPERAEEAYKSALSVDPDFPEALNNLGLLLRNANRAADALPLLERAVAARDDFVDAYVNLALTRMALGEGKGAAEAYERVVALTPDDVISRTNLGQLYVEMGEKDRARQVLTDALPLAGDNVAALLTIGNGLRRAGDPKTAVTAVRAAVKANPKGPTPALLSELALAEHAAGEKDTAKKTIRRAIKLDPKYGTAHYVLATMLASDGKLRQAANHYERYLKLDPGGPHAGKAAERLQMIRSGAKKK